ncbi:ubiquitin family protein [Halocatena halophila]|uniref:hypothetical protein n=1 Tax=Halocatena halophila TaxID=2814576 RepID=UPI002ED109CA
MCVRVELNGVLTVRTGVERSSVEVPDEATPVDIVEALERECGPQIRPALLKGDRLRSDTVAIRTSTDGSQQLTSQSTIRDGDTVRFEFEDPDLPAYN